MGSSNFLNHKLNDFSSRFQNILKFKKLRKISSRKCWKVFRFEDEVVPNGNDCIEVLESYRHLCFQKNLILGKSNFWTPRTVCCTIEINVTKSRDTVAQLMLIQLSKFVETTMDAYIFSIFFFAASAE